MTHITLPRATVEQALEAMRRAVPTGKITLYEWDKAVSDLSAALAQQAEPVQEPITDYWYQHYVVDGLCGLCGNRGVIDTRGTTTPAGVAVGGLHYCICPNGQTMRRNKAALAEPVLQTCNCRWDGEVQVQQCTLHEAHVDAIHEWAERAKVAERKLEQQAEPVAWEGWWLHHGQHNYRAKPLTSERVKELMKLAFEVGREAAPPQRKPLTDEEIAAEWQKASECAGNSEAAVTASQFVQMFARAIERAHGVKE